MLQYREAGAAHAEAIAALIATTWGTPGDIEWIRRFLGDQTRQTTIIAVTTSGDVERVVGFCGGFTTYGHNGALRWEVDLLAVHPEARGRGLGTELVARASGAGARREVALQRALIAVGNIASERCFAASGFHVAQTCELWVGAPDPSGQAVPLPQAAHLVPVDTLTYRGIWIEGQPDSNTFKSAQQRAHAENRGTVGAVIPVVTPHDGKSVGFTCVGTYRWWVLT